MAGDRRRRHAGAGAARPRTRATTCRRWRRPITDRTRAIIVCSPNNPTGPIVTQAEFDAFLAAVPADVLDHPRRGICRVRDRSRCRRRPATCSAKGHPNVVVLRTFSKAFGLAGLRIGYAIGHPRILDAARSTSIPLSVTAQAEEAALASLDAEEELLERVRAIAERRDRLAAGAARERAGACRRRRATSCGCPPATRRWRSRQAFDDGGAHRAALRRRRHPHHPSGEEESVEKVLADRGIRCPKTSQRPTPGAG